MPLTKDRPIAKKKLPGKQPLGGRRRRRRRRHPVKQPRGLRMSPTYVKQPPPAQPPQPPPDPRGGGAPPVFGSDLGHAQLKRLLWRAGFGPRPGDVDALSGRALADVVQSLTRPQGDATLVGPAPHDDDGNPLAPQDSWGHDHLWWLDRMVRSDQQLVERMTLIWHDWFATSNDSVGNTKLMIGQNETLRGGALGSFKDLLTAVTKDPAMLIWLNGIDNRKRAANENYAREMMELFSLGADRGAYTETDIREMARTLTGWRNDWSNQLGAHNFRCDASFHDIKNKTVFGHTGNFDYRDAVRLCVEHP